MQLLFTKTECQENILYLEDLFEELMQIFYSKKPTREEP